LNLYQKYQKSLVSLTVFNILREKQLYLTSADKLQFFARTLKILGHIIDEHRLIMDPHKVNTVKNWKVPTSKDLLTSFLGVVGYLAPNCPGIRVPMAVLTPLTGSKAIWDWGPTEQRAFEEVKKRVEEWRENHRKSLDHSKNAPPVHLINDSSLSGAGSAVVQGFDVRTAYVIAFWNAKFTAAQQNYPVHERKLLAIIESLK
jgi:hypothetical protein